MANALERRDAVILAENKLFSGGYTQVVGDTNRFTNGNKSFRLHGPTREWAGFARQVNNSGNNSETLLQTIRLTDDVELNLTSQL